MGKNKQKLINNKRMTEEERELLEDMFGKDYSSIIKENTQTHLRDRALSKEDNPFEECYMIGME